VRGPQPVKAARIAGDLIDESETVDAEATCPNSGA